MDNLPIYSHRYFDKIRLHHFLKRCPSQDILFVGHHVVFAKGSATFACLNISELAGISVKIELDY